MTSGLGSGLLTTVTLTALSWTAGSSNRGQVMSVFQLANNSGIALYPLIGGAIGSLLSWRATFVVAAAGALIAGAILMPLLARIERTQKRDAVSGRTQALEFDLTPRRRRIALGSIYAGVVANMINRHGFRNTLLPLFAACVLFLGPVKIATGIAVMAIVGIVVVTPGARLGDRIGRRRIVVAGLLMLAVGDLTFLGAQRLSRRSCSRRPRSWDAVTSSRARRPRFSRNSCHHSNGHRSWQDIASSSISGLWSGRLLLAGLMEAYGPTTRRSWSAAAIVASWRAGSQAW